MSRNFITGILVLSMTLVLGCNKEKTVTSTEYIHDIEYVETPPDTVFFVDTVVTHDSVLVYAVDTVVLIDTTIQTIVDTVIDTVVTVEHHYDTVVITDTVLTTQCSPNEHFAFTAVQYYTDPLVIELVYQEFGLTDGWIFYLSEFQSDLTVQSTSVYDIYGLIDYWTTDWSGFYPLEYYWRVSFLGGDPADVANWELSEPPGSASVDTQPGLRVLEDAAQARAVRH